jgi:hypothetical protein
MIGWKWSAIFENNTAMTNMNVLHPYFMCIIAYPVLGTILNSAMFRNHTLSWTSAFRIQYINMQERYGPGRLKSLFRKLSWPISMYGLAILLQELKITDGVKTFVRGVTRQKRVSGRNSHSVNQEILRLLLVTEISLPKLQKCPPMGAGPD